MRRPCLGTNGRCPHAALTTHTRCPTCQQAYDAERWANGKSERYNTDYRKQRAALLATQPPCHWCGQPATTADHHAGGLVPACQPCNSARGGRNEP